MKSVGTTVPGGSGMVIVTGTSKLNRSGLEFGTKHRACFDVNPGGGT